MNPLFSLRARRTRRPAPSRLAPLCLLSALALAASCGGPSATSESTLPAPATGVIADDTADEPEEQLPELAFPDEPFRTTQPEAGEPRPFHLPAVQRFKLKNGIDVFLVEQRELPTVSIELNFSGGTQNDPRGKEGLASMCMDMLTEGTQKLDKLAFQEALADTASTVRSYAQSDTHGISMGTLSKHIDHTHALFVDALLRPGLRDEDLQRMQQRRLDALKQAKASPAPVAWRVSGPVLYGERHFRGRVPTERSYEAITVADCKTFHQRYIKPRGARLFIVGDMTQAQVRDYFEKRLGRWSGSAPRAARQPAPQSRQGRIFFVDIPGSAQSSVYLMHFGPQRKAADHLANDMMAAVLGGGFSSRINMNLREDKGYSYGARGTFQYNRDHGVFHMSSSVRSDSTYQTVLEMLAEIDGLKSNTRPVTIDELTREKNGLILGLPGQFATARQALGRYRELAYHDLPLDYYNTYVDRVGAVTAEQVMAAAAKHLDLGAARIIVVGDASAPVIQRVDGKDAPFMKDGAQVTLLDGLRALVDSGAVGPGGLVFLDADGNVISR